MFSKSKSTPDVKAVPSIISADLTIRGDMMTSGEIQVDGEVWGDIRARAVTVGEHADIQGEIVAESIVVKGKVNGRLRGRAVHLTRTARVTGDIWHKTLGVEGGAIIQGQCCNMDEPDAPIDADARADKVVGQVVPHRPTTGGDLTWRGGEAAGADLLTGVAAVNG